MIVFSVPPRSWTNVGLNINTRKRHVDETETRVYVNFSDIWIMIFCIFVYFQSSKLFCSISAKPVLVNANSGQFGNRVRIPDKYHSSAKSLPVYTAGSIFLLVLLGRHFELKVQISSSNFSGPYWGHCIGFCYREYKNIFFVFLIITRLHFPNCVTFY